MAACDAARPPSRRLRRDSTRRSSSLRSSWPWSSWRSLFRGGRLLGGRCRGALLRGGLLRGGARRLATPALGRAGGTLLGQQAERLGRLDGLGRVLLGHGPVRFAVGDVGAVEAILDGHVLAGFGIGAELAQRRLRGAASTAASVFRLGEQFLRLVDVHGEDLILRGERPRLGLAVGSGLGQVGAVPALFASTVTSPSSPVSVLASS